MRGFQRTDQWFSLCGLNCGLCPMRLDGHCPGCGGGEGNQSCKIARCSLDRGGVAYCFQCGDYPCGRYEGIDEFDSFITHQNRLADMERARREGAAAYGARQAEKAELLRYLLSRYNDGRRKSFFCLAVNLLELEEIRAVLHTFSQTPGLDREPLKAQSQRLADLFRQAAQARGIELRLRRKRGNASP